MCELESGMTPANRRGCREPLQRGDECSNLSRAVFWGQHERCCTRGWRHWCRAVLRCSQLRATARREGARTFVMS